MRIKPRRPAHRATTAHLQAAYPFISEGGLGSEGVYIGRDVFGGSFCYDAWALYGKEITGPNMLVIGQIGYAKSSLVKCLDEDTEIVDPRTGVPRTIAEVFKDPLVDRVLTLRDQRHVEAVGELFAALLHLAKDVAGKVLFKEILAEFFAAVDEGEAERWNGVAGGEGAGDESFADLELVADVHGNDLVLGDFSFEAGPGVDDVG